MTLSEVILPITYEWGCDHALLFDDTLAMRLAELHAQVGSPDCKAVPVRTIDGRWLLTADILTAVEPGGYLHAMWEAADKAVIGSAVEVVPIAEGISLVARATLDEAATL